MFVFGVVASTKVGIAITYYLHSTSITVRTHLKILIPGYATDQSSFFWLNTCGTVLKAAV